MSNQFTKDDLFDTIIEIDEMYHTCLKSASRKVPFENCDTCPYSIMNNNHKSIMRDIHADYVSGCTYRFQKLISEWDDDKDKVIDIKFDSEYRILRVDYEKDGTQYSEAFDQIKAIGKDLHEILKNSTAKVVGVINLHTGVRVKIGNTDYFKRNYISGVKGYLGYKDGIEYDSQRRDIFGWNKPEWIVQWEKG